MIVGLLTIASNGKENIVDVIHVENNDQKRVGDLVNLKSLNSSEGINNFDSSGNDLSLTDYIGKNHLTPVNIDGLEASQLFITFSDSGESEYTYEINICLIYEEERILSYEEAKQVEEKQKMALDLLVEKKHK